MPPLMAMLCLMMMPFFYFDTPRHAGYAAAASPCVAFIARAFAALICRLRFHDYAAADMRRFRAA